MKFHRWHWCIILYLLLWILWILYLNVTTVAPDVDSSSYVFQQSIFYGKEENDIDIEVIDNDYLNFYKGVIFFPDSMTGWRLVDYRVPLNIQYGHEELVLYTSRNVVFVANVQFSWKIRREIDAIKYFVQHTSTSPIWLDIYEWEYVPPWIKMFGINEVVDNDVNVTDYIYAQYIRGPLIGCFGILSRELTSDNLNQNKMLVMKNVSTIAKIRINKYPDTDKFLEVIDINVTDVTMCKDVSPSETSLRQNCDSWEESLSSSKPDFRPLFPYINFACPP